MAKFSFQSWAESLPPSRTDELLKDLAAVLEKHNVYLNAANIGFGNNCPAIEIKGRDDDYYFKCPRLPLYYEVKK